MSITLDKTCMCKQINSYWSHCNTLMHLTKISTLIIQDPYWSINLNNLLRLYKFGNSFLHCCPSYWNTLPIAIEDSVVCFFLSIKITYIWAILKWSSPRLRYYRCVILISLMYSYRGIIKSALISIFSIFFPYVTFSYPQILFYLVSYFMCRQPMA